METAEEKNKKSWRKYLLLFLVLVVLLFIFTDRDELWEWKHDGYTDTVAFDASHVKTGLYQATISDEGEFFYVYKYTSYDIVEIIPHSKNEKLSLYVLQDEKGSYHLMGRYNASLDTNYIDIRTMMVEFKTEKEMRAILDQTHDFIYLGKKYTATGSDAAMAGTISSPHFYKPD